MTAAKPVIWPNPILKKKDRDILSWACISVSTQSPIAFPNAISAPVNFRRPRRTNVGFTQARPSFYTEPVAATPRLRIEWPLPIRKKSLTRSLITGSITTVDNPKPLGVVSWANPQKKKRFPQDWKSNFILGEDIPDQNLPIRRQLLALPHLKRLYSFTWLQSSRITDTANPLVPYDYPNPRKLKYPTLSYTYNLLQNTLDPGVGEVPFYQTDYPNPRGIKFTPIWLQDKKFYYEEPSLQISQFDWPLFRPIRRNSVGYIYSQLQESSSFFTSLTVVPRVKKVTAITFVDNPARFIIIPEGLMPFAQYDWPLFFKLKRFNSLLTLATLGSRILPPILGRVLCLIADEAEYDLFAEDKLYDVRATQTDYDLDVDGRECQ